MIHWRTGLGWFVRSPEDGTGVAAVEVAIEAQEVAGEARELAEQALSSEAALEGAEARIDAANDLAEGIAEAAMTTELGRRIGELETECLGLKEQVRDLTESRTGLMEGMAELRGLIAGQALQSLTEANQSQQSTEPDTSSLTPPPSQVVLPEEVIPEPEGQKEEESPAHRRRIRRL